jgi:hypothetical protein
VDRAFVLRCRRRRIRLRFHVRSRFRFGSELQRLGKLKRFFLHDRLNFIQELRFVLGCSRAQRPLRDIGWRDIGLFSSCGRHAGVLVLVLGVAGVAPRLPDVFANHRDDCVISNTSLTRTIVVEYVTEPRPALLH